MIYASIDIGSDTIKIVVAEKIKDHINVLGAINTKTVGIKKGIIVDSEMVYRSLNLALLEIEKEVGFKIDKAILNIPSIDTTINVLNGEVYTDGIITGSDIVNCFKSAIKGNTPDDLEVITIFPIDFTVDDEDKYTNPKGVNGYKLESRILVSMVPKEIVYPYLEVLDRCNVEVIDLALGCISDFYNMEKDDFKNGVGALINIGESKTEIGVFNKGLLIKTDILGIGSKKIDQDIRYVYNIDRITARYLKENVAMATSKYAKEDFFFECENVNGEKKQINQVELSQVVEERLKEILKNVKNSLNELTNREIRYIIITGGISNLSGFNYLVLDCFGDITYTINMNTIGVRNNIYGTCFGMIKYLCDKLELRDINYTMYEKNDNKNYGNVLEKIQNFINNN